MSEGPKLTRTFKDKLNAGMVSFSQPLVVTSQTALGGVGALMVNPRREKVAIVGTAPSSRMLAPVNDPSWDIWVCSPGNMNLFPRVDAWFEIHGNLLWPEYADAYGKNYLDWLSKQQFPVYLQDEPWHKKYFEHGIRFPMREMVKKFGEYFFTSSFAWMMALAIDRGYKEIGLYGVDMASKDEYIQQRQAFFYWLEKARNLGITVTIPPESDLMQPPGLYGFSDVTRYGRKKHARKVELQSRVAQLEQVEESKLMNQLQSVRDTKNYLKGAIEDLDYDVSIWISIGDEIEKDSLENALETVKAAGYSVSKSAESQSIAATILPPAFQVVPSPELSGNGTAKTPEIKKIHQRQPKIETDQDPQESGNA